MNIRKILSSVSVVVTFVATLSLAQTQTDNILVDQFGYREQAKKIAIVRTPQRGLGAPSTYNPGGEFEVIDDASGSPVFSGGLTSFRNGQTDAASGDKIWHFDFSSVSAPGRYYVLDKTNNVRSFPFKIANDVYRDVLKAAVKTFYYQRAGIAKTAQYAGEWADAMCFDQDRQTRDFFDSTNTSKARDLQGGWFDAGDFNKYTKWTADYITEMLLMYEENPDAFTDDFGIPESGNNVPDILDEAKWGLAWLLRMQNADGSMLSVQGLGGGSPPSSVTARSYYGPANATATFGSVRTFAIASRVFGGRGDAQYAQELKTAAVKAWEWGVANPDSMFNNNSSSNKSSGLAAGNQEMDNSTAARDENVAAAAWYLFELTEDATLLPYVEDNLRKFPLFVWGGSFMDHYRHSMHMLYIRYINDPRGNQTLKTDIRSRLSNALKGNNDFNSPSGYVTDGYRAFIKDYNWGSNKAKADYGLTFYKWNTVDQSIDQKEFKERAEGYLHYIHGANPFNMVFLTNMERYGASRSQKEFYHTWFGEGTKWSKNPAPGFLPGGPNSRYKWDGCCPSGCWSTENNAKCFLVPIPDSSVTPPAKMYIESNIGWPINTWEITENSNGYQLGYIRLLSKFASADGNVSIAQRRPAGTKTAGKADFYKLRRGSIDLKVREKAEIRVFKLNGALVSKRSFTGGVHNMALTKLPKGIYVVRMSVDGQNMVLRMPVVLNY